MHLSQSELYALKAFTEGKDVWRKVLPAQSQWRQVLENVIANHGVAAFQKALYAMLDATTAHQMMCLDTDAPLPSEQEQAPQSAIPAIQVKAPKSAVGAWQRDYVKWAADTANETPIIFHEGTSLFLGALAIGRRVCLHTHWNEALYPNLYIMMVAVSTYYRKTAALRLATQVAKGAIPHMLLPEPGSPENFINLLAGEVNFASLKPRDKARFERALPFSGQRGVIRDELSGLFKSMARDYMAGMKERIMQMYDCPDYLDISTNTRGIVTARNIALSILGAATPAELRIALTLGDWHNGTLARFALLTPEPDYAERPSAIEPQSPNGLIARLRKLHESLPEPRMPNDEQESEEWSLTVEKAPEFWREVGAYEKALRELTRPGSGLEDELRALYGRLHIHALKVAIILTMLDWADSGAKGRPVVTLDHLRRAFEISEAWRASAHRFKVQMTETLESLIEDRILAYIRARGALTARDVYRGLALKAKDANEALERLLNAGQIIAYEKGRQIVYSCPA